MQAHRKLFPDLWRLQLMGMISQTLSITFYTMNICFIISVVVLVEDIKSIHCLKLHVPMKVYI